MDALTIACAVVQFVDYGTKLVITFSKLLKSGDALPENIELENLTTDLSDLIDRLAHSQRPWGDATQQRDVQALQSLARSSQKTANELLEVLQDLKVRGNYRKLQSAKQAVRALIKKEKIEQLKTQLDRIQNQIQTHLSSIMSNQQSCIQMQLKQLTRRTEEMDINNTDLLQQIKEDLIETLKYAKKSSRNDENLAGLVTNLTKAAREAKKVEAEQNILESLRFESMRARQINIKDATPATCEWIHQHQGFSSWLKSGNGVYWIAGKAGSGKSTLLKYLCEHQRTKQVLKDWSDADNLLILKYFFWSAGNTMQKSQKGLLQSLLYQTLKQYPSLIVEICPFRLSGLQDEYKAVKDEPWSYEQLADSFDRLAKQTVVNLKICMFVDGLDEYEGEKTELISVLQSLSATSNIKLCVASRPWTVFNDVFGQNEDVKLQVQDYTRDDLRRHVNFRLTANTRHAALQKENKQYVEFVESIVDKAQGVFLWVYLVTGSLLRGLEEHDDIADLQARLEELPKDLEEYFRHIFDHIEDTYREQTARVFLLTVQAVRSLPIVVFDFLDSEQANPDYALDLRADALPDDQVESIYRRMKARLNARCKDLLEVNEYENEPVLLKYRVDFLHRTVRDFLLTKDMHDMLESRASSDFDATNSLCKVMLALLKSLPLESGIESELNSVFALVDECFYYASESEAYNKKSVAVLLDELDRSVGQHAQHLDFHWSNFRDPPDSLSEEYGEKTFLACAVQARLYQYVVDKLNNHRTLPDKKGRPLLDYALRPTIVTPIQLPPHHTNLNIQMITFLLDKGANPNQKINIYNWRTVWDLFLLSCYNNQKSSSILKSSNRIQIYQVATLLLERGADPNLKCDVGTTETTSARYQRTVETKRLLSVSEVLSTCLSTQDMTKLDVLLEEKRRSWKNTLYGFLKWT